MLFLLFGNSIVPQFCDPMYCSMPGIPVLYILPKFAQSHVHRISDTIQSFHPLSSLSPPAISLSQHQDVFQWINSSHQVFKYWSFSIRPSKEIQGWFPLGMTGCSSCCPRYYQESSIAPQLQRINSSALRFLYGPTLTSVHD